MKNKYFFSLALAALMLGACSDDNGLNDKEQGPVLPGEKGYVCLSINLPTQKGGRANDVFSDGDAVEYNVKDATLLIFSGNTESAAVFSGAYELTTNFTPSSPADDNITTSSKITQAITKPTGDNVYALVVLNKEGLLSESGGTWFYGGSTSFSGSTKFSDFATSVHELNVSTIASTSNGGNFLMLNAPLFSKPGGTASPEGGNLTTLAVIDKTKIYSTEAEAMTNPAANIYVERAVAKVTVKEGTSLASGDGDKLTSATLEGWVLDITNKKTYPVRNIETTNPWWSYTSSYLSSGKDYRFVGSIAVATDVYRTYWGKDPNYDGQGYTDSNHGVNVTTEFNDLSNTTPSSLLTMGTNAYCLENTFDVENMRKDQTTRVIVAAKLEVDGANTDGSFYTLNDDKGVIYKQDGIVSKIKQEYLDNPTINALLHDPATGLNGGSTLDESYIKVEFAKGTAEAEDIGTLEGGTITVKSIYIDGSADTLFKGGSVPAGLASNNSTVTDILNTNNKISYYKGGIAYYPIQIKHFGDGQTPWNENEDFTDSYPGNDGKRAADFLGRYGVLRNNWYEIEVTSVKKIGSAEVEPETGYDDPIASWIGVNINILSWAKRLQSVEL